MSKFTLPALLACACFAATGFSPSKVDSRVVEFDSFFSAEAQNASAFDENSASAPLSKRIQNPTGKKIEDPTGKYDRL
jgi:uncharacterized membrane protein YoaK (UPF0700 family)